MWMSGDFLSDLYTEPAEVDPDTLRDLGPLAVQTVWAGKRQGADVVSPQADECRAGRDR
jgi:hypothetical protein